MNRRLDTSDQVTVLLFKDNLAARTFEIPLRWISWVGTLLGLLVILAISSCFIAGKYYWMSLRTSAGHVETLEQEISTLKSSLHELEKKAPTAVNSSSISSTVGTPSGTTSSEHVQANTPSPVGPVGEFTFLSFPATAKLTPPDPAQLSFAIRNPKAYWSGNKLKVRLSLQYTKGDEGNQQGQIIILSRGPDSILAYPSGVLTTVDKKMVIDLDKGESFSVSRFREVKADFPSFHAYSGHGAQGTSGTVQSVEVFLFTKDHQLLSYLSLTPEERKGQRTSQATEEALPATEPTSAEVAPEQNPEPQP